METNPRGHLLGLRFLSTHYQLPLVITKNGIASADSLSLDGKVHDAARIDFLNTHLLQVRRALQEGIDIRGYFYWSAMDNFEWQNGFFPALWPHLCRSQHPKAKP